MKKHIAVTAGLLLVASCGHLTPAFAHDRGNDTYVAPDPAGVFSPVVDYRTGASAPVEGHFCTGFYIGEGRFVSAGHCLSDATSEWRILVENPNGGTHTLKPDFTLTSNMATFNGQDFSVAFVDPKLTDDLTALSLKCDYAPKVGDAVAMEGFPADLGREVTTGYIAAAKATKVGGWSQPLFRTQLPSAGGFSGSPVRLGGIDGPVIGILVGSLPDDKVLSLVQPLAPLCKVLNIKGVDTAAPAS